MLKQNTIQSGSAAEQIACEYLKKQGLIFIEKNYRCPCGEIDLIMKSKNELIFVEVRMRTHISYGKNIETVTSQKQQKVAKTALHYLQRYNLLNSFYCRFDVVGVSKSEEICWIQNAFEFEY